MFAWQVNQSVLIKSPPKMLNELLSVPIMHRNREVKIVFVMKNYRVEGGKNLIMVHGVNSI